MTNFSALLDETMQMSHSSNKTNGNIEDNVNFINDYKNVNSDTCWNVETNARGNRKDMEWVDLTSEFYLMNRKVCHFVMLQWSSSSCTPIRLIHGEGD